MSTQILQTVCRAVAMLRAFEGGDVEFTLTELSGRLGLEKVGTLRLARTLVHEGLLTHDPRSRRYALSLGCLALCRGLLHRNGLVETARPHMEQARDATGETVCLMVREGWQRVVVESIPSKQPVRYVLEIGNHRPVYLGAAGQCLISGLGPDEWHELTVYLEGERNAGRLHLGPDVISERVQSLRDRGWAMARGEWAAEAAGAAASIYDGSRKVVAAITIAIPLTRASESHMEMCGRMAMATAQSISVDLTRYGG